MGCFNQSCNLTHVDINDNDVCMMLPILSNSKENGGYESLNDGPFRYFKPFCLPIVGKYDHYGRIDDIRKDRNTELLEKYFEISISDFIECISGQRDMYGDYSTIQKVYGKGDIGLTVEDLAKIHFKTGDDKVVTHPYIEHLNKFLIEKYAKESKPFIPIKIYWKTDKELVVQQMDYQDKLHEHSSSVSYEGGEKYAGKDFLETIHSAYESWNKKLSYYRDPFIFGVPSAKQARAQTLLKLTRSFIRPEAYKAISKIFSRRHDKYLKRSPDTQKWANQRQGEYFDAVQRWRDAVAIQKKYEGKLDTELTPEEVKARNKSYFASMGREDLFRGPVSHGFKSTYSGEEFLAIYGDVLTDVEFLKKFTEFSFMERGMIAGNVLIYENHSLEQHGDIDEELSYLKVCLSVANKVAKQRRADYY